MGLAVRRQTNERLFCWEQVLRVNGVFRISHAFAPVERARQILPLYALFAAIEETCSECSEADLARRRLDWWRHEFTRLQSDGSDHPILRELTLSGAASRLRRESLWQLLDDAESRLDEPAPAGLDDLRERARLLSRPQMELELSLSGCGIQARPFIDGPGVLLGVAQLLRESTRRGAPDGFWWLPLTLLARHGVRRSDLGLNPVPEPVISLFSELIGGVADRVSGDETPTASDGGDRAGSRHLFVHAHLQLRALHRLQARQPHQFANELHRAGLRQLYHAWQAARRFNRL